MVRTAEPTPDVHVRESASNGNWMDAKYMLMLNCFREYNALSPDSDIVKTLIISQIRRQGLVVPRTYP